MNELIGKIVDEEWAQFQLVNNQGGRASCQDNWRQFSIMRGSQFSVWPENLLQDLEEPRADGDPCKIEYYLNKQFMDLKDAGDDAQCCCYGYFQGGEATAGFEELLRRDSENKRRADIVFVLDELEKHYAQYKPELVSAVRSVKESYK